MKEEQQDLKIYIGIVERILKKFTNDRSNLLPILQDIQGEMKYLPKMMLERVSKKLDVPLTQIYHLSTFYRSFSLIPRGAHLLTVCTGTACHVKGAASILNTLDRELHVKPGTTSYDGEYTLETVNCLGSCALAPLVVRDGEYHGRMSGPKVLSLLIKGEENGSEKS